MSCHHIFNLLSAYIDGELTGAQMLEVRRHLSDCEECRKEYEELLQTKQLLANLTFAMPKAGFADELCKKLDEVSYASKRRFHFGDLFHVKFSPVAAALAVVAIALTVFGNMGLQPLEQNESAIKVASNPEILEANTISTIPELPEELVLFTNNKPLPVASNIAHQNYSFAFADY
ncbi:MAG: zf-HC2 domain-containing protein [Armatimonadota bacterium]